MLGFLVHSLQFRSRLGFLQKRSLAGYGLETEHDVRLQRRVRNEASTSIQSLGLLNRRAKTILIYNYNKGSTKSTKAMATTIATHMKMLWSSTAVMQLLMVMTVVRVFMTTQLRSFVSLIVGASPMTSSVVLAETLSTRP